MLNLQKPPPVRPLVGRLAEVSLLTEILGVVVVVSIPRSSSTAASSAEPVSAVPRVTMTTPRVSHVTLIVCVSLVPSAPVLVAPVTGNSSVVVHGVLPLVVIVTGVRVSVPTPHQG